MKLKPIYRFVIGGSTISALEVRRQKEEELRKNDQYWQTRLSKQEEDLKKTAAILEKEYNETVQTIIHCVHSKNIAH